MNSDPFIQLEQTKQEAGYRVDPEPAKTPVHDTVDPVSLSEDELVKDATFQQNANVLYKDYLATRPQAMGRNRTANRTNVLTDPEDIANWAIEKTARFNNSFADMVLDYSKLRQKPPAVLDAFMQVWDAYEATPTTSKQRWRAAGILATDPTSWMGFGLLGKGVAKGMSKAAVRSHLRTLVSKATPTATVGAAEGAAFTGGDATVRESLTAQNEGRDMDWTVPMVYTGVGAAAGGILAGGADMAVRYSAGALKNRLRLFRGADHAADPMASKSAAGAPTFSDNPADAAQHGKKVYVAGVEPNSPAEIDSMIEMDDLQKQFDLSDDEMSILQREMAQPDEEAEAPLADELQTKMWSFELAESPTFAQMLRDRGFDMVIQNYKYDGGRKVYTVLDDDIIKRAQLNDFPMTMETPYGGAPYTIIKAGAGKGEVKAAMKEWQEKGLQSSFFRRWSEDAPVVDGKGMSVEVRQLGFGESAYTQFETGKPVVVQTYHGSTMLAKDDKFSLDRLGDRTGAASAKEGFFFAGNPRTANEYAYNYDISSGIGASVHQFFVRMKNPLVYDYQGASYGNYGEHPTYTQLIKQAKDAGHDGVIMQNTHDPKPDNIFVTFEPNNIKSTMQKGNFSENPSYMNSAIAAPIIPYAGQDDDD